MIKRKRKSEIMQALDALSKEDVFSMLLFVLYKLRDNPDYSTLSELSYILDSSNLVKFISFFGGTTISVPTLREFRLITQAMLLYEFVNLENGNLNEGLEVICNKEFKKEELLEAYLKITEVARDYDFHRERG